jgi:hypothetical protein
MSKKITLVTLIAVLVSLLAVTTALAAVAKYTFNDVDIDGAIVEIEASVKDNRGSQFSTCTYYSDGYLDWLGQYQEAVAAGDTAEEVLAFCVSNFDERSQ